MMMMMIDDDDDDDDRLCDFGGLRSSSTRPNATRKEGDDGGWCWCIVLTLLCRTDLLRAADIHE